MSLRMNFKVSVKWMVYLVSISLLGVLLLLVFYVWMIYGTHTSDEGQSSLACEYDQNFQVTKAEMMTIQNGKRVISKADPLLCEKDRNNF